MPGPYPLATLAAQITSTGISAPSYQDIYNSLVASYQAIYGTDVDLDPDSQDGQLLAVFATAYNDMNNALIATYNAYRPDYAKGNGLSSIVKINGLRRNVATASTVPITLVGQTGKTILNGQVGDNQGLGTVWNLPASVTFPGSGTITVTATCTQLGATQAAPNTLTVILTPTLGWQSANNGSAATPGSPVEQDAALRERQAASTSLPAVTPQTSILAAVENLAGVTRAAIYVNPTGTTDSNGVPAHSFSIVAEGGDPVAIATAIFEKKSEGTGTYGTTSETITDSAGQTSIINFFVLGDTTIYVIVNGNALAGYVSTTATIMRWAIAAAINSLAIGQKVIFNKLWSAANLSGSAALAGANDYGAQNNAGTFTQTQLDALSETFELTSMFIGTAPSPTGTADIPIAFNYAAVTPPGNGSTPPADIAVNIS